MRLFANMRICPHCQTETEADVCALDGYKTVLKKNTVTTSDLSGTTFQGRYRIEEMLGSGGMGAVYRATQLSVDRPVALKVIHSKLADNMSDVARFQQEARAIAALHHPNIVSLIDFGQADTGELFLVMEHLQGMSLGRLIRKEAPLSAERVIHITRQIFEALHQAHSNEIVHRDMKPENIFVSEMGRKGDFVKVLDFGIAKVNKNDGAVLTSITQTGTIVGSPRYMAPEQARGREVTGQTDLYAVGAMMYEMVTGKPVFDAASATDCVIMHVTQAPPRPVVNGEYVSGPLVGLILSLLEKDPESRPPGAEVCLQQLEAMGENALFTSGPANPDDHVPTPSEVILGAKPAKKPEDMPATMTLGEWRGAMDPTVATPSPLPDIDTRRAITSAELGIESGHEVPVESVGASNRPKSVPANRAVVAVVGFGVFALIVAIGFGIIGITSGTDESSSRTSSSTSKGQAVAGVSKDSDVPEVGLDVVKASLQNVSHSQDKALESPGSLVEPTTGKPTEETPKKGGSDDKKVEDSDRGEGGSEGTEEPLKQVPEEIKRELISIPKATVMSEGKRLGTTPFVVRWMSDQKAPVVRLIRSGYKSASVQMKASSEGISQRVSLKRKRSQAPKSKTPNVKKKRFKADYLFP